MSDSRHVKAAIDQITTILATEATAKGLSVTSGSKATSAIGAEYTTTTLSSESISIVPILRSGLGMLDSLQALLPTPVPIHHLGLFRQPATLSPVEYYNKLPHSPSLTNPSHNLAASHLAFLVDPIIATGGTAAAAIQTLKEWGVGRIIVLSILGATEGVVRAANEWPEGTEIWLAGVDEGVDARGMITPGVGDVGDRLFMTVGK